MKSINRKLVLSATDLSNHLACSHLTQLNRRHESGELQRPVRKNQFLERMITRGLEHETAYIRQLTLEHGDSVLEIDFHDAHALEKTHRAMQQGIKVIAQGELANDQWNGRPDLLLRVERPSPALGAWSYEVADTKLTKTTRAGTILQLCIYSDLIAEFQGLNPEHMYVVMPSDDSTNPFQEEQHRFDDYAAYYRLAKSELLNITRKETQSISTYPEPVSHCDICQWWPECEARRRADDHLTFVAGIQKAQIKELESQGITTLTALATTQLIAQPRSISESALKRIQNQAKIQHKGLNSGNPEFEYIDVHYPTERDGQLRGFLKLPAPDNDDLFFDIESARHAPYGGLEYLFGFAHGDSSAPEFDHYWGLDHHSEKGMFEHFIDLAINRFARSPGMHIYHFAPYEPVALKRLATRHATREDELDTLLRKQCFVDLYAVTRQAIRASVESYSIKCLEPFYGYVRLEELADARAAMHHLEALLEMGVGSQITEQDKQTVLQYNRDDCLSTIALRNWLEKLRSEQIQRGISLPRPPTPEDYQPDSVDGTEEVQRVFHSLTDGLADLTEQQMTPDQRGRWLLAHALEYFRREQKNAWWEYFRLRELDELELIRERNAITGLAFQAVIPKTGRERNETHRYSYSSQFVTVDIGADLIEVSSAHGPPGEFKVGTVVSIDHDNSTVDIKKAATSKDKHPHAVFSHTAINPDPMPAALLSFGNAILESKSPGNIYTAQYDMLIKRAPRFKNDTSITSTLAKSTVERAHELIDSLDSSVLAIQGPPGTGKTYTASRVIEKLAKQGNRIGITAVSHAVIANLLGSVHTASAGSVSIAHKGSKDQVSAAACAVLSNKDKVLDSLDSGAVAGATSWTWAAPEMEQQLDYLFIDEAGQMSLPMALAAARAAKNVVLLGDPQQLEQPQRAAHPQGSDVAALAHLIGDSQTISDQQGLFLDTTYRMHPGICQFTSEQYYDGKLKSHPPLDLQIIEGPSTHAGKQLVFIPVEHTGNQSVCAEEITQIQATIATLLDQPHHWTDSGMSAAVLNADDILIVAPYNAQVAALRRALPDAIKVGTVDKFQGQQAPVVIYSLTSSSADDAPRGLSFLFSPNRFNVATSRAKCTVLVFGSPTLLAAECKSPEQIRWLNGLCRFVEMAKLP